MIPRRFSLATAQSFTDSVRIVKPADLQPLAAHCPGLLQFDWENYLYCSMWRVEKVLQQLKPMTIGYLRSEDEKETPWPARLLDFGSWLGNFSLAANYAGWRVTAAECWGRYSPALQPQRQLLLQAGILTVDIDDIQAGFLAWDVVLMMSVIEHIPHSPRELLQRVYNFVRPGGYLILDTPNLAYIANRRRLNRGISPYVPIQEQFSTEIPFEGHNREYTADEVEWMLDATGFQVLRTEFYNYSMYGVSYPRLLNARSIIPMSLDPTKRELIFVVARKPL